MNPLETIRTALAAIGRRVSETSDRLERLNGDRQKRVDAYIAQNPDRVVRKNGS